MCEVVRWKRLLWLLLLLHLERIYALELLLLNMVGHIWLEVGERMLVGVHTTLGGW